MAGRRPNVRGSSLSSLDSGTGISLSSLSSHPAINRLHSVATIEEISSSSSSASRITNAIQLLQGEQEKVQKKTFTNWMNSYLEKHNPPLKVNDLFVDIQTGVVLLYLLESLSGESLPVEKGFTLKRVHFISNVATALRFLESRKIKLVNINVTDIVDGKPSIVLGLIWVIILYFQIEENTRLLAKQRKTSLAQQDDLQQTTKVSGGAKQAMLAWAQKTITPKYGLDIKDFGPSWRDGLAFNAIIHSINPGLVNMDELQFKTARDNLEDAFRKAEEHLGIPRLLDPEDVDVERPDEKSIMTYLAKFLEKFSDANASADAAGKEVDPATKEETDFNKLLSWVNDATQLLVSVVKTPVTNQHEEYQAYEKFMTDFRGRTQVYEQLQAKVTAKQLLKVSESSWTELQQKWTKVIELTRVWRLKLDSSLPGRLGEIGKWIHLVGLLVEGEIDYGKTPEEAVRNITERLGQLKNALAQLEDNREELLLAVRSGKYKGETLLSVQMQDLEKRFTTIIPKSEASIKKLEYEEAKYRLLSSMDSAQLKMENMRSKCGQLSVLKNKFQEYQSSVLDARVIDELNANASDLRKRAEVLKIVFTQSKPDAEKLNRDVSAIQQKLTDTTADLFHLHSQLEESVKLWSSYDDQVADFEAWVSAAEVVLTRPLTEQEEFFEGLESWSGKVQFLKDTVSQLRQQKVLDDAASQEMGGHVEVVERQWKEMKQKAQMSRQVAVAESRSDYRNHVARLKAALVESEDLMKSNVHASSREIHEHISSLKKQSALEGDLMDVLKTATRISHQLVKESHAAEITEMKVELQTLKDGLTRTFRGLAEKESVLQAVLPTVESLTGKALIVEQLAQKGESLLESNKAAKDISRKKSLVALKEYTAEINDQLPMIETLNDEHKGLLRNRSASFLTVPPLEMHSARIQRLLETVPVQVKRTEFLEAHESFCETLEDAQKEIEMQNVALRQKLANPADLLVKFQEIFCRNDVQRLCSSTLETMKTLNEQLMTIDKPDILFQRLLKDDTAKLDKLSVEVEKLRILLEDVPEKRKEYNTRLANFENYMMEMEELSRKLNDKNLSPEEYREVLERFKELQKQSGYYQAEADWLNRTLKELSGFDGTEDVKMNEDRLVALLHQQQDLKPAVEKTLIVSATVTECHELKEAVEKHMRRLSEIASVFKEEGGISDLNSGRLLLAEQEEALSKLLYQKQVLEEYIRKGTEMISRGHAPSFMVQTVDETRDALSETIASAQSKCHTLRVAVETWEEFESGQIKLKDLVRNADVEAKKAALPGGHEAVRKELTSRVELLSQLQQMQSDAEKLQALQEVIGTAAGEASMSRLQEDCTALEGDVSRLKTQVEARIEELQKSDNQWKRFEEKLESVAGWIEVKENEGKTVKDESHSDPEKQLTEAQTSLLEVKQRGEMLEQLEKDIDDITKGARSREVANVRAKLAKLKRQQSVIETETLQKTEARVEDVKNWHVFQNSVQQLVPVIRRLEEMSESVESTKFASTSDILKCLQENKDCLSEIEPYQDVVLSCTTASSRIPHVPGVTDEAGKVQQKWEGAVQSIKDHRQRLEKSLETWTTFESQQQQLRKVLETAKIAEPNITALDLEYLQNQIICYETIVGNAKSQESLLDVTSQLLSQISPLLSQSALSKVTEDHMSLNSAYQLTVEDARQKLSSLVIVYNQRKDLLQKVDAFDKSLVTTRSHIEGTKEVYSDEANFALSEIQRYGADCQTQSDEFGQLEMEVSRVIEECVDENDKQNLSDRLSQLRSTHSSLRELAEDRAFVISEWMTFQDGAKKCKETVGVIQQRLEMPDLSLQELEDMSNRLKETRETFNDLTSNHGDLQTKMMDTRTVFKDRKTNRILSLKVESDSLQNAFSRTELLLSRKTEKQNELTAMWTDLEDQRSQLSGSLKEIQNQVVSSSLAKTSLEGVESLYVIIGDLESQLLSLNSDYEEFRKLCRQLKSADDIRQHEVQMELNDVENLWEEVHQDLESRLAAVSAVYKQWKLYADAKAEIEKTLALVESAVKEDVSIATYKDALQTFDRADADLNGQKRQFVSLMTSGNQLADEAASIPGFSAKAIREEQNQCDDRWNNAIRLLSEAKEFVQKQLILWEQVEKNKVELEHWLAGAMARLRQQAAGIFDAAAAQQNLTDYQDKLPQMTEVFNSTCEKAKTLEELNKKPQSAATLRGLTSSLSSEFQSAEDLAGILMERLAGFSEQKRSLEYNIDAKLQQLVKLQERLQEADNVLGNADDILRRMNVAKGVSEELDVYRVQLEDSRHSVEQLASTVQSSDISLLVKEVTGNVKKCDMTRQAAGNVLKALQRALERDLETSLKDAVHWLSSMLEKVAWCSDFRGDKYSTETKYTTALEVEESLPYGEEKRKDFVVKYEKSKQALTQEKRAQFEEEMRANDNSLTELKGQLLKTRVRLEDIMTHWRQFDQLLNEQNELIDKLQEQLRDHKNLLPSLEAKEDRLKALSDLGSVMDKMMPSFGKLSEEADVISSCTSDSKPTNAVFQLREKYNALTSVIKDLVERQTVSCEDHKAYVNALTSVTDWLRSSQKQVENCPITFEDVPAAKDGVNAVKRLLSNKSEGQDLLSSVRHRGEKLYPSTSLDGREIIHQELRDVHDQWETFVDRLDRLFQQTEGTLLQLEDFDKLSMEVSSSLEGFERRIVNDIVSSDTLEEKRTSLQECRTLLHELSSYRLVVENVMEIGRSIPSDVVQQKWEHLSSTFHSLVDKAKQQLQNGEEVVTNHCQYADAYEQCQGWLHSVQTKLATCKEQTTDKKIVSDRIDKVLALSGLKDSWESKQLSVIHLGEKVSAQTGVKGQRAIRGEIGQLEKDWKHLTDEVTATLKELQSLKLAWDDFDQLYNELVKWLQGVEQQLKEQELKASLREKDAQVQRLKELETLVLSKSSALVDLKTKSQRLQISEEQKSIFIGQPNNQYQTVVRQLQNSIEVYAHNARLHEQYDSNFASCTQLLSDLSQRLTHVVEENDDAQKVKESSVNLKGLVAEKAAAGILVNQVTEAGEKLHLSTSAEGFDIIRQQNRALRERWERFTDDLNEAEQNYNLLLVKLLTLEEGCQQFSQWMDGVKKTIVGYCLQATINDKKTQLQHFKVLCEDVTYHEKVLDSLVGQSRPLSISAKFQTSKEIQLLSDQYKELLKTSKARLSKATEAVEDHQKFEDLYQRGLDLLSSVEDLLSSVKDETGNPFILQNKLDKVEDARELQSSFDPLLHQISSSCESVLTSTSEAGHTALKGDLKMLSDRNEQILPNIETMSTRLKLSRQKFVDLEGTQHDLESWLQSIEVYLKTIELKSNLEEKKKMANEIQETANAVDAKSSAFESLTKATRSLVQSSGGDSGIMKHTVKLISQHKVIQKSVQDLLARWNASVTEHCLFNEKVGVLIARMDGIKDSVNTISDLLTTGRGLEKTNEELHTLMTEKISGQEEMNAVVVQGEKLSATTATAGREKIRQQVLGLKNEWNMLLSEADSLQKRADGSRILWQAYRKDIEQLKHLLLVKDKWVTADMRLLKDSLEEKREQLQARKVVLQDMLSYEKLIDSAEQMSTELKNMTMRESEFGELSTEIVPKYTSLVTALKEAINNSTQRVAEHANCLLQYSAVTDLLQEIANRVKVCDRIEVDKHSTKTWQQLIQEVDAAVQDGEGKLKECYRLVNTTVVNTGAKGRLLIEEERKDVEEKWAGLLLSISRMRQRLTTSSEKLDDFEDCLEKFGDWIKMQEAKAKAFVLVATVEEKRSNVNALQNLLKEVKDNEAWLNSLQEKQANFLEGQKSGGGNYGLTSSRIQLAAQQMTTRYQSLMVTTESLLNNARQNLEQHELYCNAYDSAHKWLQTAKQMFSSCAGLINSKEDVQRKRVIVQELSAEKEEGLGLISEAAEAGEKLHPTTSADGRETIRHQIRLLKQEFEAFLDSVHGSQREVEVLLVDWGSFEDSLEQLGSWLDSKDAVLGGAVPMHRMLEDKKMQLLTFRSLLQDILSYQHLIDGIVSKAQLMAQTTNDTSIMPRVSRMNDVYVRLCSTAKERVDLYEDIVKDHLAYNSAVNSLRDWLKMVREKLKLQQEITGDISETQNRLEKLEASDSLVKEGEEKLKRITDCSEKVIPNTLTEGQDVIFREVHDSQNQLAHLQNVISKMKTELEKCVSIWKNFEQVESGCRTAMRGAETQLRNVELRPTLATKREQLSQIRRLQEEFSGYVSKIEDLHTDTDILMKLTTDASLSSHVDQLSARFHHQLSIIKEAVSLWERYVNDHQLFEEQKQNFIEWHRDALSRLKLCIPSKETKFTLETKLNRLRELSAFKDEGFERLENTVSQSEVVSRNTAAAGRDSINRSIIDFQGIMKDLVSSVNATKEKLELALLLQASFSSSVTQLTEWLHNTEDEINLLGDLPATLTKQKMQLDKANVLSLKILGQKSEVVILKQTAQKLVDSGFDEKDVESAETLGDKFDNISKRAEAIVKKCERNVTEHLSLQDAFNRAADWLNVTNEKLLFCADVEGDYHVVMAKHEKLQDLLKMLPEGELRLKEVVACCDVVMKVINGAGQAKIREEVLSLTNDIEHRNSAIQEKSLQLKAAAETWKQFNEGYEEGSNWLRNMESKARQSFSLRSSLTDKQQALDDYRKFMGDIEGRADHFRELSRLSQVLLESCSDAGFIEQVAQFKSRYATLVEHAKNQSRILEHHVDDHKHFLSSCDAFMDWFNSANSGLDEFLHVAREKESLQTQLNQFYDFSTRREEAVILMISADVYGKKTMLSTSGVGLSKITEKLNDMQREWNSFQASLAETKARLEASLMKWSDVDSGISQLRCWMKEVTRRLLEVDHLSTLNEKKAQLQRTKALQKEIAAKEHSVSQLKTESKELGDTEKSLTSDIDLIVKEYEALNSQAMISLTTIEGSVNQHVKLNEEWEEFGKWLNSSKESLAANQADEKLESVENCITTVLKLEENLRVGDILLQEVTQTADLVCQTTSSAGCSRIKQELDSVAGDFEDYKTRLAASHQGLELCKKLWVEYDAKKTLFRSWLEEMGSHFKSDLSYGSSLQEKEMQYQTHQGYHDEILAKQEDLDSLNHKAKELLDNISSVHVVQEVTEMVNRHQSLLYASQERLKKIESAYLEHLQFDEASTEYDSWLEDIRGRLQSMEDVGDERAELETKLAELALIESSLGKARAKMLAVTEQGNVVLLHSSPTGAVNVRKEMKDLSEKFEDVKSDLMRGKATLEGMVGSFSLFEYTWEKVNSWLDKTEDSIKDLQPGIQHGDLHDKRTILDKTKLLSGHVESYKSELDNLSLLFSKLPGTTSFDISESLHRWESLSGGASEQLALLRQQIADHEQYLSTRTELERQLSKLESAVRNVETSRGSIDERMDKLKDLKSHATDLVSQCEDVTAVGDRVVSSTSVEDANKIQTDLQRCRDTLRSLHVATNKMEEDFKLAKKDLLEYREVRDELLDWLNVTEKKLKNTVANMDLSSVDQGNTDVQTVCKEILESPLLQKLLAKSDNVHRLFPEEGIDKEVAALVLRFNALQNDARDDETKVASLKKDVSLFVEMVAKHQTRLISAKQSLDQSRQISGDDSEIELKFQVMQNLISELCTGEPINDLTSQCQAILDRVKPEERVQVEGQLKVIQEEYIKLTEDLNSASGFMKSWIEKRNAYNHLSSGIEGLLSEMGSERDILSMPSDLSARHDQLNRLKNSLNTLNGREDEVRELTGLAEELSAQQGRDEWKKEAIELREKFQNRQRQLEAVIETLETSCSFQQSYNDVLCDCERRLVAMSIKFTAHRSVCIQTYETTRLRMNEHKELMSELGSYQSTISNIEELGQKLIVTNPNLNDLKQEVEAQLKTITDTYSSLKLAANQIKDRLVDALEHWQSCELLVDDCSAYINAEALQVLHEDISSFSDCETVTLKIGKTKEILNSLQKFSQEILTAMEKEKSFTCSDPSLHEGVEPTVLLSPLQRKVQNVNKKLSDVLSRLSEHLGILKEAELKWFEVEKLKAQLIDWISDKEMEIKQLSNRLVKLHPDSVEHEIRELERYLLELQEKGPTLEKLTIRYTRLIPNNADLVQIQVQPIKTLWDSLVATVKEQITGRREFLAQTKALHRKQARLTQSSNDLDMRIDQTLADGGASAEEKKRRLESPVSSRGTQTVLSVLRGSTPPAHRTTKLPLMQGHLQRLTRSQTGIEMSGLSGKSGKSSRSTTDLSNSDRTARPHRAAVGQSSDQQGRGARQKSNPPLHSFKGYDPSTPQDARTKRFQKPHGHTKSSLSFSSDSLANKPSNGKRGGKQSEQMNDTELDRESGYEETIRSFSTEQQETHDAGAPQSARSFRKGKIGLPNAQNRSPRLGTADRNPSEADGERYLTDSDDTVLEVHAADRNDDCFGAESLMSGSLGNTPRSVFVSPRTAEHPATSEGMRGRHQQGDVPRHVRSPTTIYFQNFQDDEEIMSCHSGLTEPDPVSTPIPGQEFGTQTVSSEFEESIDEEEDDDDDGLETQLRVSSNHLFETLDFGQQTPSDSATQTPLLLRLGASAVFPAAQQDMYFLADMDASDADGGIFLQPLAFGTPRDADAASAREFGTQTFGQVTDTPQHVETQTADQENQRTVSFKKPRHHKKESGHRKGHEKSKHRSRDEKNRTEKKSNRKSEHEDESFQSDSSRTDLLKLMLHQVRSIKGEVLEKLGERPSEPEEIHQDNHNHHHRKSHRKAKEKSKGEEDSRASSRRSRTERPESGSSYTPEFRRLTHRAAEDRQMRRRHSVESLISESAIQGNYDPHEHRQMNRVRRMTENRAKTPPADWKPAYSVGRQQPPARDAFRHFHAAQSLHPSQAGQPEHLINSPWQQHPHLYEPLHQQSSPVQVVTTSPIVFIPDSQRQGEQNIGQTYTVVAAPPQMMMSDGQEDRDSKKRHKSHRSASSRHSKPSSDVKLSLAKANKETKLMKTIIRKIKEESNM